MMVSSSTIKIRSFSTGTGLSFWRKNILFIEQFQGKLRDYCNASLFRGNLPSIGQGCWRKFYSGNISWSVNQKDDPA
jgi:hypothetical protein